MKRFQQKYPLLVSVLFGLTILTAAHFTYFKNYFLPTEIYWDEAYHIPSAAKYLENVFFMEPHPPLGKMLIAAGEKILNPNFGNTFDLEKTEVRVGPMPEGFTFAGYRFFPALAGWLNALLFALILVELTGSRKWALLLSPLYIFDNALITASRGALLDSLMLFGALLTLWSFLRLFNLPQLSSGRAKWAGAVMVLGFSFAVMTKVLAAVLILLWPALLLLKWNQRPARIILAKAYIAQMLFFALFFSFHFGAFISLAPTRLREASVLMATLPLPATTKKFCYVCRIIFRR